MALFLVISSFDVMVNRIVSSVSLPDLSVLVYKNARDFCVLILYPENLPNSLMISHHFLGVSLGYSMYSIMSSTKFDILTSSPSWIHFIYFSSLTAGARTSKTILKNSGKGRHPCLALDLRESALAFPH